MQNEESKFIYMYNSSKPDPPALQDKVQKHCEKMKRGMGVSSYKVAYVRS